MIFFSFFLALLVATPLVAENKTQRDKQSLQSLVARQVHYQGFLPVPFWDSMAWRRGSTGQQFFTDSHLKIAEKNFNNFCSRVAALPRPDYSKPPHSYSIPPIIHFIWLGSPIPEKVDVVIGSWKKYHPGWKIRVWTDAEIPGFSWSSLRLQTAFIQANNWAEKADILRLEILYQLGGIYSDTDVICLNSFHDLLAAGLTFFAGLEVNHVSRGSDFFYTGTAIMGAVRGSSIIKYSLDHYRTTEEAPGVHITVRSGPGLVSRACREALDSSDKDSILILPCSYFYPLPYGYKQISSENFLNFIAPESLGVHLWDASWMR